MASRFLAWSLLAACIAASAEAADIPIVEVTAAGPAQPIDLRSPLYLRGKRPENANRIRAVLVRYSFPVWSIPSLSDNCTKVGRALSAPTISGNSATLFDAATGTQVVDTFFDPPDNAKFPGGASVFSDHASDPVLFSSEWKPASKTDEEYKVLLDASDFFRVGARYCLFVFANKSEPSMLVEVTNAIVTWASSSFSCGDKVDCREEALTVLFRIVESSTGKLGEAEKTRIDALLRSELLSATDRLFSHRTKIMDFLKSWRTAITPQPLPGAADPSGLEIVTTSPSASVALKLMTRNGSAHLLSGPKYWTEDGATEINYIGFTERLNQVQVAKNQMDFEKPPAKDRPSPSHRSLNIDLGALPVEGSAVTYADLVAFSLGKIKWDGKFRTVDELEDSIDAILTTPTNLTAHREKLSKLAVWISGIGGALEIAHNPKSTPLYYRDIKVWMERAIRGDAATKPESFYGFETWNDSPFGKVVARIEDLQVDYDEYNTLIASKTLEIQKSSTEVLTSVPLRVAIDQPAFFTNYVVTSFGRAVLSGPDGTFGTFYGSLQLYLWANPVDRPMWTNGVEDWRRTFAIEVGIGFEDGPFGDHGRVQGAPILGGHPVFFGAVLHAVPYITLSGGCAILSHRRTGLEEERGEVAAAGYFALSVQGNFPDLIRALVTSGAGTSATVP